MRRNAAQLQMVEVHPGTPPLPTAAVKEPVLLSQQIDPDGAIIFEGNGARLGSAVTRLSG